MEGDTVCLSVYYHAWRGGAQGAEEERAELEVLVELLVGDDVELDLTAREGLIRARAEMIAIL